MRIYVTEDIRRVVWGGLARVNVFGVNFGAEVMNMSRRGGAEPLRPRMNSVPFIIIRLDLFILLQYLHLLNGMYVDSLDSVDNSSRVYFTSDLRLYSRVILIKIDNYASEFVRPRWHNMQIFFEMRRT